MEGMWLKIKFIFEILTSLIGYTQPNEPYFSAILGRVANRIAGATFEIDGVRYNVTVNDGSNQLHGGIVAFDKVCITGISYFHFSIIYSFLLHYIHVHG